MKALDQTRASHKPTYAGFSRREWGMYALGWAAAAIGGPLVNALFESIYGG